MILCVHLPKMRTGVMLLLPLLAVADPDPNRGAKRGFRERIR